jgi:hypothetical protein
MKRKLCRAASVELRSSSHRRAFFTPVFGLSGITSSVTPPKNSKVRICEAIQQPSPHISHTFCGDVKTPGSMLGGEPKDGCFSCYYGKSNWPGWRYGTPSSLARLDAAEAISSKSLGLRYDNNHSQKR